MLSLHYISACERNKAKKNRDMGASVLLSNDEWMPICYKLAIEPPPTKIVVVQRLI